jgi:LmbE family N-acetylglucosaminyl deacetylase
LSVKASLRGLWTDPYIEMRDGELIHRQYFERGVTGSRYLNFSPFCQRGNYNYATTWRLSLRGVGLSWKEDASLLAYDPPAIEGASVLVIAPHPDDAEIAAFGLYADRRSWVVTITAGEKSTANLPAGIVGAARPHWAAFLRVADSLSIPVLGRVPPSRRLNLAYPDGALKSMYLEPSRRFSLGCEASLSRRDLRSQNQMPEFRDCESGCTWKGLVEDLGRLIDLTQPDIVICPHPVIDTHSDHAYVTIALQHAVHERAGKRPEFLLYAVHVQGVPLHPLGPGNSLVGAAPGHFEGNVADAIYSHCLTPELQRRKYFAVEAMHAMRALGEVGETRIPRSAASVIRRISLLLTGVGHDLTSFLRRAPRPNEIYYVAHAELLSNLVEQRLGRDSPRSAGVPCLGA